MGEMSENFGTRERALNAAIAWLEQRGAVFGPHRQIQIGRIGTFAGAETGVKSLDPFWRLRLDFDEFKGPHYNAEFGKGAQGQKKAFCFSADQRTVQRMAHRRAPRR